MRAQNVQHGATLLRVSFGREPGLKGGFSNATLQLPQAALKRRHQVWIAEFSDCDYVVACSGAQSELLQYELRVLQAGGSLSKEFGGFGHERGVAHPQRAVMRCGWGRKVGRLHDRCARVRVQGIGIVVEKRRGRL